MWQAVTGAAKAVVNFVKENVDTIQTALDAAGMIPVIGEICDVASGIISVAKGDWVGAGLSLASVVPIIGNASGAAKLAKNAVKLVNKADDIVDAGKAITKVANKADEGFNSFKAFKKAAGSAGERKEWHHIVEESQITKTGFIAQQVHNANNITAIRQTDHYKITGYYNSIDRRYSESMRVRDYLAGQSYDFQFDFGMDVLGRYGY